MERLHYEVKGGPIIEAYAKFEANFNEAQQQRRALRDEIGADGIFGNDERIHGFVFKDTEKVPQGWKELQHTVFAPNQKTKDGRALAKRMKIRVPTWKDFQDLVIKSGSAFTFSMFTARGFTSYHLMVEKIGDRMILLVPDMPLPDDEDLTKKSSKRWAPDEQCVLLKNSEYWAMKEAVQEKEAA